MFIRNELISPGGFWGSCFDGGCSQKPLLGLTQRAFPAGWGRIKGRDEGQVRWACTAQTQLLYAFATSGQQKKIIVAIVSVDVLVFIADLQGPYFCFFSCVLLVVFVCFL